MTLPLFDSPEDQDRSKDDERAEFAPLDQPSLVEPEPEETPAQAYRRVHDILATATDDAMAPDTFALLNDDRQMMAAILQTKALIDNGGLPAVYYNNAAFLARPALRGLEAIGATEHAQAMKTYIEAIGSNPYLGPPEIWPTENAPPDHDDDADPLAHCDDAWLEIDRRINLYQLIEAYIDRHAQAFA